MELQIRAKHLLNADYLDNDACAIVLALREVLPNGGPEYVSEAVSEVAIGESWLNSWSYQHESYLPKHFTNDLAQAKEADPDTVIRTIEIPDLNLQDYATRN